MTLIRQLENRRKYEEREKKKHQVFTNPKLQNQLTQQYNTNVIDGFGQIVDA